MQYRYCFSSLKVCYPTLWSISEYKFKCQALQIAPPPQSNAYSLTTHSIYKLYNIEISLILRKTLYVCISLNVN